jgi:hypothetical protein
VNGMRTRTWSTLVMRKAAFSTIGDNEDR